jgi:mannose/fructose-specific phosphotransferase system component IIA/predicted MFS family arabinose efflux permease
MSGSLGMVASTLPVQWLMPLLGWRGLFWLIAALLAVSMAAIVACVPADAGVRASAPQASGYAAIWRQRTFLRFAPLAFFHYGGMIAIQSLWAGPWLVRVCGWTPEAAAAGLFAINLSMLAAFLVWGLAVPRLYRAGWTAQRLVTWGVPVSLLLLLLAIGLGERATAWTWTLFCVSSSVLSLSQPAVGQASPADQAGRALSAYNLVIFGGIFTLQWGLGLAVDAFSQSGASTLSAFRGAVALLAVCAMASYLWFLRYEDASAAAGPIERVRVVDNFRSMPGLLIIAHAPLASSLKAVAGHAFPDCAQRLEALDVQPDMTVEQIETQARELLAKVRRPEALIFTDVFGATPCNVAQRLADGVQVKVIAGVNVPMLWRSLCYADESLDALVARAVAGATQGVMQVATSRPQNQTFKPGGNDQDHRHHQQ